MSQDHAPRTCASCGNVAPSTETEYTLIGAKHAWRRQKAKDAEGKAFLEWYCPTCWRNRTKSISPKSG